MTSMKEGELLLSEERLNGGALVKKISTPDEAVGRVVVIILRTKHEKRYGIDETIDMAGPPYGTERNCRAPGRKGTLLARKRYKRPFSHQIIRTAEIQMDSHESGKMGRRGFLLFTKGRAYLSAQEGINQSLSAMSEFVHTFPSIAPPKSISSGDKTKTGLKLMEWIAQPSKKLSGYPRNWVRSPENIPEEGPWTPWEQTLILNKWLSSLGWETKIWWQASMELDKESPVLQAFGHHLSSSCLQTEAKLNFIRQDRHLLTE